MFVKDPDGLTVELNFHGIADAQRAGLAVIYQELVLVEEMTVAENICLGSEPRRGPFIDWEKVHRQAHELLKKFGVAIDPATPVARLGVGEKQLVEIVNCPPSGIASNAFVAIFQKTCRS